MTTMPPSPQNRLSILVVDDDPMVREVTAFMLGDAGHEVREAGDGVEALDALEAAPADLLITDINMPRMDGLKLVQEVKARWPAMPVLLVSGRPQPPGTQAYMAKPFSWDMLLTAVTRALPGCEAPRHV